MAERVVSPSDRAFAATVEVPGDKSLSHRSLIFAAMANGASELSNLGPGEDVGATLRAVQAFGATWDGATMSSPGIDSWSEPGSPIDCGNSGTAMRLLAGVTAGRPFHTELSGDDSLSRRPMERVAGPLRLLGAGVETAEGGTAPMHITGGSLEGASVSIDVATAQVRSAFELAAVQANGVSTIDSPPGYRDHTERMLESWGRGERLGSTAFRIHPGPVPPGSYDIPGDPSSAAFLWASAAIREGAAVTTPGVSLNPGRIGFLQVLGEMGAQVDGVVSGEFHGDPVGTVTVRGSGLGAAFVPAELVAATVDELPLVAVVAAYGEGITKVTGASELRTKESDRITSTVAMIRALGGGADEESDGFTVLGTGFLEGGVVEARRDHRIAMAAAVAATAANGSVTVSGAEAAAVSWPGFYEILESTWSSR